MAKLFEPITLRGLTVRNRVWLAPMCQYSCENRDGMPGHWHLVHLGARATGGFGLILTEAAAVLPEGRISPQDAGIWSDAHAEAWAPIVDFAHSQGAAIGMQLAHAGRKASTYRPFVGEPSGSVPEAEGGWATVGPSALAFEGLAEPAALSREAIAEVVEAFAAAARRADAAGFDTVEIHAAHGYLLHSFLSPLSNVRDDEYGGDLAGRSRLLMEVYTAVREAFPEDKPVLVRISASEWTDGGFDVAEATEVSIALQDAGADLIDVSSGGNVIADIPVGPSYQVPLAAEIAAAGVTTGAVGLITEPAQAEGILVSGDADVVLLARAALREPAWPQRAAHALGLNWRDAPYPPQYTRGKW
ncbi:NADH:flavin oxidoreductase/NADH oxidase [Brevibacterium luteolum]|uniref:NADH:flavin oxidoreductase/NADH oxidase n=1 Tax=Brevibacterium luteolum TaxID=199591 RepID=UPI00223B7152|nr:NADH:flavin oxidoreductase/NADH oxidase [Brevibacterium luteolum]MCT1874413.1 NADH:flavin oxidoreductase/NADH oxidase [Brevibacterium luteolum]MCT1889444.1 NADH:flavin oxidoreductase/NADH oxidase [Brevibacterium luteolum]MCT1894089.1 NADH:flavin oxidoreductase/NADH oxidase [Brevibacterium luteolum]MCT1922695.1 NADH:flavin oxidoreductase/NADH oxidase [Brevibacterium luteolum]MCT1924938.1 NADH:flavin oxidoreductase/NADH oxidase [Brevibacterium luteolum]